MSERALLRIYPLVLATGSWSATDLAALEAAATLAQQHNGSVHAIVVVNEADAEAVNSKATAVGVSSLTVVEMPDDQDELQVHQFAEMFVSLIDGQLSAEARANDNAIFLVSAGTRLEEAAGLIAAHCGALPLGRITEFSSNSTNGLAVTRSGYGGRLNIEHVIHRPCVAAVRAPRVASGAPYAAAHEPALRSMPMPSLPAPYPVTASGETENEKNLEGARVVISGGRGMAKDRGFELLRELARHLDAAVGGSLPAVDAGWASVSRQIGQSGKYVSPAIYLAVGISGTPQHLAGIDPHTSIIAINKDPEAPIFQVARFGVVAAWEDFLPLLIKATESEAKAISS